MNNNLGTYIRSKRGDSSLREFARRCDMSHTHLDSIEKGYDPRTKKSLSLSLETLTKLARGTGTELTHLVNLATTDGKYDVAMADGDQLFLIEAKASNQKDLKKFLEQSEIMFDGVPLTAEDKEKVKRALELAFWDAKKENKRKKS